MYFIGRVFGFLLLSGLIACASGAPDGGQVQAGDDAVVPVQAVFQCGDKRVETRFAADSLDLRFDGAEYRLVLVRSGSGAKYEGEAADGRILFWEKGDKALLEVGEVRYPECNRMTAVALEDGGDRASLLTGGEWVVEDIARKGIIDYSRVTLNFGADGRLAGRATCNQYSAGYSLEEGLKLGAIALTRMACPPALMHQEALFTRVLAEVTDFEIRPDGALVLTTAAGETITAFKEIRP